jgi:hypothetical protein
MTAATVSRWIRPLYVLGSLSPLFVILLIKGEPMVNDKPIVPALPYYIAVGILAVLPFAAVAFRWRQAVVNHDHDVIRVARPTDSKDYLLVYLLAVLTPLYDASFTSTRDWAASVFILIVIIYLFCHFDLYHMNLLFALKGYRTFVVQGYGDNPLACRKPVVVLSKRTYLTEMELHVVRLSNTVFIEREEH